MEKSEGKGPLGRPRRRWEDSIIMYLRWEGVDWIRMAQEREQWRVLVKTVMNIGWHKRRGIS
jgi:hypothetical protein